MTPKMAYKYGYRNFTIFLILPIGFPSISSPTIQLQKLSNLVPKQGRIVQISAPFRADHLLPFPLYRLQKFQAQVAPYLANQMKSLTKSMSVLIQRDQYRSVMSLGCALRMALTKQCIPVLKYYCSMSAQRYQQKWSLSLLSIMLSIVFSIYFITSQVYKQLMLSFREGSLFGR